MSLHSWWRSSLLSLACFTAFAFPGSIFATGEGFQPISPDELKMTAEPLAPGAPAVILYRQVDRDDSGLTAHENDYSRIKILKDEGRKYGDIEIPFYREHGTNVVNIHARTIRPDGTVVNFDGKVFNKSIVKAKGLKYMAKTFTLPDVQPGSILEYYYTLDLPEYYIFDSHWILSDELFTKHAKFSLKPYTSFYQNWHVRWSWHLLPQGTEAPQEGPDHIIRMESSNIPAFQSEDFMPPENELKARVDFTYTEDFEVKDPAQFWRNRGKKLDGAVEGFIGKRKGMEQALTQIVSPDDSPEVKLQKIYARVQQLRNTSYEIRKTEQELKRDKQKENANVEDVWKHQYGDGTEINWLFLALTRAAGLESYAIYASERRNYFFNPAMMDIHKLDSDLVLVKLNGKEVFSDPGAALTPFGLVMWPETGVAGLQLDKDGGTWITTAVPESSKSRIIRKADLTLSETGDLEGKLTVTFTGLEAMQRRNEELHEDDADRKKTLEDEAKDYVAAASEVELTNQPDWKSSDSPLVAEFKVKIPGWVSGAGRRALLPVGLFSSDEKHVFEHTDRVYPIYFNYPWQKEDDISISLPLGWQVASVPKEQHVNAGAAVYQLKADNDKGGIHVSRKLNFDLILLEQKYYPTLRNFFQLVRTGDDEQVVLQPIGANASK